MLFVVAWALGRMPAVFALPAGLGDIAAGAAAPFVARRAQGRSERWEGIVAGWNLAGIADLFVAVSLGFLTSPSPLPQLSTGDPNWLITRLSFVLIPTLAVPLSVLLHLAVLERLRPTV